MTTGMKSFRLLLITLLAFCLCSLKTYTARANDNDGIEELDVALVTTYGPDYQWSRRIIEHLEEQINKSGDRSATYFFPIGGIDSKAKMNALLKEMRTCLDESQPKRIILIGSSAFSLCEDINSWYPDIPMMLIGGQAFTASKESIYKHKLGKDADRITMEELKEKCNITSQNTPVYVNEITDLIVSLMPELETLFYIGGSDQFSSFKEYDIRTYIETNYPALKLETISAEDYSDAMLVNRLGGNDPKKNAVIFSSWPGTSTDASEAIKINVTLATIATLGIPLFTLRDNGWMDASSDIVGGCFVNEEDYNAHLDIALQKLLSGVPPAEIQDYHALEPVTKLNYEKMLSFGMNPAICKVGTVFTHKNWKKSDEVRNLFWIMMAFIAIILAFAFGEWYKIQRALYYAQESLEIMPMLYFRGKAVFDKEGNIINCIPLAGNKLMHERTANKKIEYGEVTVKDIYPEDAEDFIYYVNDAYKRGKPNTRFQIHSATDDIFVAFNVTFLKGNMLGVIGKNVTDEVKATERINEARKKAEIADQFKTQFIQNMSHEIRTPLNAVLGFSQLLALPVDFTTEEERAEYTEYIMNNSRLLMMLIDDILDMADAEKGNYRIVYSDFSINSLCRSAMKTVEYRVPPGVAFNMTSEVDDSVTLHSDPNRVQQVLINYLTNACKHTTEGEILIHVSTSENPGKVTFSVTDTGEGVPPEMAENIFERFTKLNEFVQGSGLGLNICKTISEKLGGEVKLDTSYKGGARFVFIL